jgi:hypothetical protein
VSTLEAISQPPSGRQQSFTFCSVESVRPDVRTLFRVDVPEADMVIEAERLAWSLLQDVPERWVHTCAVAHLAADLSSTVSSGGKPLLIAAAWLHDIGYAPALRSSGFHPLDGARHLTEYGWSVDLATLVAHHSGARYVASVRGLSAELAVYHYEDSPVMDALTYADQARGPAGKAFRVEERIADMLRRHGPDSPTARANRHRAPYLLEATERVRQRLAQSPSG